MQTSFNLRSYFSRVLMLTSLLFACSAKAESSIQELSDCNVDAKKILRGMCMAVGNRSLAAEPQGRFRFAYQIKLLQASCADPRKESEEQIATKVKTVWAKYMDNAKCSGNQFDIDNGSIIKYAINMKFDEFILDTAAWKVNLNIVDDSDGRTVLDYLEAQIKRNKGTANEPVLKRYLWTLKEAGAKHASEL